MACKLCGGELLVRRVENKGGDYSENPCTRCLTTSATDEIREVSSVDYWRKVGNWPVFPKFYGPPSTGLECPVLPLYLDAGRDLAVRVLAKGWQCEVETPRLDRGRLMWGQGKWVAHERGIWSHYNSGHPYENGREPWPRPDCLALIPALAALPINAHTDLRIARALVLCLETI